MQEVWKIWHCDLKTIRAQVAYRKYTILNTDWHKHTHTHIKTHKDCLILNFEQSWQKNNKLCSDAEKLKNYYKLQEMCQTIWCRIYKLVFPHCWHAVKMSCTVVALCINCIAARSLPCSLFLSLSRFFCLLSSEFYFVQLINNETVLPPDIDRTTSFFCA